ncbi:hypothetical protein ACFX2J_014241 [Malus domestica]
MTRSFFPFTPPFRRSRPDLYLSLEAHRSEKQLKNHISLSVSAQLVHSSSSSSTLNGKAQIWEDDQDGYNVGGDMDELLAVLGYKVRSDDMADVADKLEQLEMVIKSA